MEQHKGEIVEKAVRNSGYYINKLAEKLKISRNTLYNRLKEPNLGYNFIMQVGAIIHYDFSRDFPEIKQEEAHKHKYYEYSSTYVPPSVTELRMLKQKYTSLLERHTRLWCILVKIAKENDLPGIKQEIDNFLASEAKQGLLHNQ